MLGWMAGWRGSGIDEQMELMAKPRDKNPPATSNTVWTAVVSKTCSEMLLPKLSKLKWQKKKIYYM